MQPLIATIQAACLITLTFVNKEAGFILNLVLYYNSNVEKIAFDKCIENVIF